MSPVRRGSRVLVAIGVHGGARGQHGAVLVFFALFAPVAVLFLSFVIDVGNWFDHARHLQLQADAGALAAAEGFQPCEDSPIYAAAGQYGGSTAVTPPTGGSVASSLPLYNKQLGGTSQSNIHELINSPTYYEQPSPVDGTVNATGPCTADMVDVKMTETSLPWYFRLLSVPYINAHARVEILERTTLTGGLPVAVNGLNPKAVEAYFVNEATGEQLTAEGKPVAVALEKRTGSGALVTWSNELAPYAVQIAKPGIGVRIAISGRASLSGAMSVDCAQSLTICYDTTSPGTGILHIQGWSGKGTGSSTAPIVRLVTLQSGTCGDGYFSDPASSCEIGASAVVDFGSETPPEGATVKAVVAGKSYALTYNSASKRWTTSALPLAAGAGSVPIELSVTDKAMGGGKGAKTFSNVQRSYTARESASGPIQAAFLSEKGEPDADSFRICESGNEGEACTHKLVVTVDLAGSLHDALSVEEAPYVMRFDNTGSQNHSIACTAANGGATYWEALAYGCAGTYGINPTLTCPGSSSPIDCVPPATGNKQNQVAEGMNQRVLGSTMPTECTNPNKWASFTFNSQGVPDVPPADPRLVTVFVTPYGSFGGSGASTEFPIADFAVFYVTGWRSSGAGFSNPCQGKGDDTAEPGTIVGHFIKYVETAPTGSGGSLCEPNSLNECIAILTN